MVFNEEEQRLREEGMFV